jgi:hypothetical protein
MVKQAIETLSDEQKGVVRDSISAVGSVTTGVTGAVAINNVIALTQAQYDAISTPDANTLYVIVE